MIKYLISLLFIGTSFSTFSIDNNTCSTKGKLRCCLDRTNRAPFYISDEFKQGEKQYENFRNIQNPNKIMQYIPRGTIVYIPNFLFEMDSPVGYRLPFEVLSVPNDRLEKTAKKTHRSLFKKMFEGVTKLKRVKKGDVGFLDKRSVRDIGDYTFLIKDDAPTFKTPRGTLLKNKRLIPIKDAGDFIVSRCCQIKEVSVGIVWDEQTCFNKYKFDIVDILTNDDGSISNDVIDSVFISPQNCRFFQGLTPIPKEDSRSISSIVSLLKDSAETAPFFQEAGIESLELVYAQNKWRGSRVRSRPKIKLMKFPMDEKTRIAPFNMRHYTPDDAGNTDALLAPYAACALFQIAKQFKKECRGIGCEVQVGNMFHKKSWNKHHSHGGGNCLDIRPFRKNTDNIREGITWHAYKKEGEKIVPDKKYLFIGYDQEKTIKFMEIAASAGATKMWFNDPAITKHFAKSKTRKKLLGKIDTTSDWNRWWIIGGRAQKGHDDHIHLCLDGQNPRVRETCLNGVR